ncbi:hypothetical protein LCGC14_2753080, partial [marine sediment metagenome]
LYRGFVIDEYLTRYEDLFKPDFIIKNAGIGGFVKLKTPQILIFQNPFYGYLKEQLKQGIISTNSNFFLTCIELMKRTAKQAFLRVAVSNYTKKEMELEGIKCDKVIEEGIDTAKFSPVIDKEKLKKDHSLPLDKKIGIAVTKFIPQKGWSILSKLIKEFPDIYWIVILTEEFGIKPKLKNVIVIEKVLPEVMSRMYNCADFFISTSPVESFGLCSLEAASCGLPVINFKTGWAWDWWDERLGLRIDNWDIESFSKAVKKIRDSDFSEFSPREALIEKGFTKEVSEKNWQKFVKEVLKKKV